MSIITGLFSQKITADDRFDFCAVSSLSIANHGASKMFVTISNVPTEVPAFDRGTMLAPMSFDIDGDGTLCDMNFDVTFEGGLGDAILYAKSAKK